MVLVQIWPVFLLFFFQAIQARKISFTIFQNEKTPFQAITRRSSRSRKIDIFSKGLTHGFGPNMAIFLIFFLGSIGQENVFYDILERKTPYQAIKTRSSKSRKISHGFGPNIASFPIFFFKQYRLGKCLLRYSRTKKRLSRL